MPNQSNHKYDLEERTAKFGEFIIDLAKKMPDTTITNSLIRQLVRAATSVGANYSEANDAASKRDFTYQIGICRRESKESKPYLRMLPRAVPSLNDPIKPLSAEAQELNLIFSSIMNKSNRS